MIDISNEYIIKITEKLQYEIYDATEEIEYDFISCTFCNSVCHISFLDIPIWDSDNDIREYNEYEDTYEDLENFLRREINNEITKLSKIKL